MKSFPYFTGLPKGWGEGLLRVVYPAVLAVKSPREESRLAPLPFPRAKFHSRRSSHSGKIHTERGVSAVTPKNTMNDLRASDTGRTSKQCAGEQAGARTILLFAVVFLLGIAVSAVWFFIGSKRSPTGGNGDNPAIQLSENTRAVLSHLDSPLEIRFYALLDPASGPDSMTAFPARVEQLLSAYQQGAGGKIKVTSVNSPSTANANAARADGLEAFNSQKGDACYLGVALVIKGHKETVPRLSPEWEQALEPDLTRAIVRLLDAGRADTVSLVVSQANATAVQDVKALIPNLAAVSVQQGNEILRDAAFKDFTAATQEMQTQVKEAEQRLVQAHNGGSEAEQQAAMKHLQEVQAEQTEKLKQIAGRSRTQLDTFQQLKAAPH